MKILCKIFGHNFMITSQVTERPYKGPHKWEGHPPHTNIITNFVCKRCLFLHYTNNYFFDYFDIKSVDKL